MAYKSITAKFDSKCKACGVPLSAGDAILWESLHKTVYCEDCGSKVLQLATLAAKAKASTIKPSPASLKAKGMPTVTPPAAYKSILDIPNPGAFEPGQVSALPPVDYAPRTQKGKGIKTLQKAGLLPGHMAIVCGTEGHALAAFAKIPGRKFCRPCPTQPRHGFVDSREVTSLAQVQQVWAETMKADPQGEVVMMPLVEAEYNCVWRPGLLAVGPGHDGATAGQESISVPLVADYGQAWKDLAVQAGVKLETQDPFIEAVSHGTIDTVVTQIRGGSKDCPSEPDWNPAPMVAGAVICIDGTVKADPDAMLAWETQAKTLTPGFHIVYDQGGNMGDHWSVHAQINQIAVVTSFKPVVGQAIPKLGVDLPPFEPQAVIWGFLGGLQGPSLKADSPQSRLRRTRATVAAILGTHHGARMGGDAGAHFGASVALFLRLGQAAIWGEARHAYTSKGNFDPSELPAIGPCKGKSRQQIFSLVLDDWTAGRAGLRDVTRCFHGQWSSGMGGKAWAAIAHAIVNLDTAMVNLVRIPSQTNCKKVLGALTTAVNLAHNGVAAGCFLNKFCSGEWFDLAASLDPRAACFAGPVWYEAAQGDTSKRMALLAQVEAMEPIEVGLKAPTGNVLGDKTEAKLAKTTITPLASVKAQGIQAHAAVAKLAKATAGGKMGSFGALSIGDPLGTTWAPKTAQAKAGDPTTLHLQIALQGGGYISGELDLDVAVPAAKPNRVIEALEKAPEVTSLGGSGVVYHSLTVDADSTGTGAIALGSIIILTFGAQAK